MGIGANLKPHLDSINHVRKPYKYSKHMLPLLQSHAKILSINLSRKINYKHLKKDSPINLYYLVLKLNNTEAVNMNCQRIKIRTNILRSWSI